MGGLGNSANLGELNLPAHGVTPVRSRTGSSQLIATGDRNQRLWLWEGFAQALVAECKPKPSALDTAANAVIGDDIDAEVTTIQDITYDRILQSDEIDVDQSRLSTLGR